jgi:hypothetical protein
LIFSFSVAAATTVLPLFDPRRFTELISDLPLFDPCRFIELISDFDFVSL